MLFPFLPNTKLSVSNVPARSIILTASPSAGLDGNVTINPPPLVSHIKPSPFVMLLAVFTIDHLILPAGSQLLAPYTSRLLVVVLYLNIPLVGLPGLSAVVPEGSVK